MNVDDLDFIIIRGRGFSASIAKNRGGYVTEKTRVLLAGDGRPPCRHLEPCVLCPHSRDHVSSVAHEGLRAGDGPQLLSERRADATPPARRMRRCDEPDTKPLYDCDLREC